MLSFTHGQPAVPMEISHFIKVHSSKILDIINEIVDIDYIVKVKFGTGAVGNGFSLSSTTCDSEKLKEVYETTISEFFEFKIANTIDSPSFQNNNYPIILDKFPQLKNLSNSLIDLSVDMWLYCSKGYLKRKTDINETGSSTMPQKINPINFENAEGNFKLACSLFDSFADNLAKSRLQRDLSDITMMRSVGMCYAYLLQGMTSLQNGFAQYEFDKELITKDLHDNVQVFSEFIQIQMKLDGFDSPYSSMKKLSMNHPTWRLQDLYNPKGEFLSIPKYIRDKIIKILEKNANTNYI